jgi:DNA polymerase-1
VGEKTAAKLINQYGGLDGIFDHVGDQTPKLKQSLADHEEQVRRNLDVMVLLRDVDLEVGVDDLDRREFDREAVRKLFDFLEFRSLHDRLAEAFPADGVLATGGGTAEVLEAEVDVLTDAAGAVTLLEGLAAADCVALAGAWEGQEGRSPLLGVAVVTGPDAAETWWLPAPVLDHLDVKAAIGQLPAVAAHGAKPLLRSLAALDIQLPALAIDTQLAAYLLDPAESRYLLDELLLRYANLRLPDEGSAAASGQLDLDGGSVPLPVSAGRRALAVDRLMAPLSAALDAQGLRVLHDTIEIPLVRVLARMEDVGVGVDGAELRRLNDELVAECQRLTSEIWADAGEEFNVNSTPKLREILFDKLALQPSKKTKTGYSTDASSLEKLVGQHDIVEHLLRYREVEKLRSTYGEGLLNEVAADGRIHATFNQTVARTGRLSSDQPNLHNIPVRSEEGRRFRKAFVPAAGCTLLVADYNQIELRCIAHLAEDPGLIEAFESGQDIHNATAARVFDVAPTEVTIDQRSKAKMVSYGLAYGMEAFGLGQRLGIRTSEAQVILDAYFDAFPNVRSYMDRTVKEARMKGYTETLFGRRRLIPELLSDNPRVRMAGERQAMNAGIQGLAADIFKVALVRLDCALEEGGFEANLILQVHDEVLLDVPPAELDRVVEVVLEAMGGAADLRVPLAVNIASGPTWADAKS